MPADIKNGLDPLLRFVNVGIQGLANALTSLSLSNNVLTEVQTVPLSHNSPQLVSLKKLKKAYGVIAISVGMSTDNNGKPIQYALKAPLHITGTTAPNQVKITAWFADTAARRVPVTFMLTPEGSYSAILPATTP